MAYTLATTALGLAKVITQVHEGSATSTPPAGTSTLTDGNYINLPASMYANGVIWFKSGTLAGKWAVITSYTPATGMFTFDAQSAPVLVGVSYAVSSCEYSQGALKAAINQALLDLGPITQQDDTLLTVEDQEEYELPNNVQHIQKVEIATETSAPYEWYTHEHWEERYPYMQRPGLLIFDYETAPQDDDYIIRLTYLAEHPELSAYNDELHTVVPIERVKWEAAINALRSRYIDLGESNPKVLELWKEANAKAVLARALPIHKVQPTPRLAGW